MSFALKQNAPCKGCESRHTRCHIKCPEYNEWAEYHKKLKTNAVKIINADKDISDYQMKNAQRSKKNHNR